jgi:hypothetical protein
MRLDRSWAGVSVSSGTLREEDLIPAFESVLDTAGVKYDRPVCVNKLMGGGELTTDEWEEVSAYLNEDLFDAMNGIAPEGTCFGSHPGDGTDFGFWRASDEEL